MDDVYNALSAVRAISPVAVGTTGTGQTGKIIDRKGYIGPVLFNIGYGSITATNATLTVTLKEGDVTGTLTSAADVDLIGTEAAAGVAVAATRTSNVSKNIDKKVGYKGGKRYCQINIKSTVTAGTLIHATALQQPASKPAT